MGSQTKKSQAHPAKKQAHEVQLDVMTNEADANKDVLLSHGDSATEVNILSSTHDCVHKTASNDRHALFPVWVHVNVLLRGALFHDLCGLRGRLRILLVPSWKLLGAPQTQMASTPVGYVFERQCRCRSKRCSRNK